MTVGTKSVLFGVHQFAWHPFTVACAWISLYGKFPKWWEAVAIFCHDLGYLRCPNMDGPEGVRHPVFGADLTFSVVHTLRRAWLAFRHPFMGVAEEDDDAFWFAERARRLALGHSRFFAKQAGISVSKLFAADKASIFFDPAWFYLLRARLSGEIWEYIANSGWPDAYPDQWYDAYRRKVRDLI